RSPDPDTIAEASRFGRRDMHHPGLFDKFAVELGRAGIAVPGLDTEERRATRFRPDSEFEKSVPGHFDRRPATGGIANGTAGELVQNDSIMVEAPLGQFKRLDLKWWGVWLWAYLYVTPALAQLEHCNGDI